MLCMCLHLGPRPFYFCSWNALLNSEEKRSHNCVYESEEDNSGVDIVLRFGSKNLIYFHHLTASACVCV